MKWMKRHFRTTTLVLVALMLCAIILPATSQGMEITESDKVSADLLGVSQDTLAAMAYAHQPSHLYPFIYDGSDSAPWLKINTSNCVIGGLYVYDQSSNNLARIGEDIATDLVSTKENLYYVTANNTLVKTDYGGTQFCPLYQLTRGDITFLYAFGYLIYIVESNRYLVVFDIETNTAETVWVEDGINRVYPFDRDKLIWYTFDNDPNYLNLSTSISTPLADEQAVDLLISPYVSLQQHHPNETYASNSTTTSLNSSNHNDISIPLPEYPASLQQDFDILVGVQSFFNGTYAGGAGQCDGFAKYAHDRFWHVHDDTRNRPSWITSSWTVTGDFVGPSLSDMQPPEEGEEPFEPSNDPNTIKFNSNVESVVSFFSNLERGTFIRYVNYNCTKRYMGNHSIFFDGIADDGEGIYVYECNQLEEFGRPNAVGYQYYPLYYVEHTPGTKSVHSTARHKTACTKCAGYLLQTHTASATYTSHNDSKHRVSFSCCSGYVLKNHVILSGPINRCKVCNWIEEI